MSDWLSAAAFPTPRASPLHSTSPPPAMPPAAHDPPPPRDDITSTSASASANAPASSASASASASAALHLPPTPPMDGATGSPIVSPGSSARGGTMHGPTDSAVAIPVLSRQTPTRDDVNDVLPQVAVVTELEVMAVLTAHEQHQHRQHHLAPAHRRGSLSLPNLAAIAPPGGPIPPPALIAVPPAPPPSSSSLMAASRPPPLNPVPQGQPQQRAGLPPLRIAIPRRTASQSSAVAAAAGPHYSALGEDGGGGWPAPIHISPLEAAAPQPWHNHHHQSHVFASSYRPQRRASSHPDLLLVELGTLAPAAASRSGSAFALNGHAAAATAPGAPALLDPAQLRMSPTSEAPVMPLAPPPLHVTLVPTTTSSAAAAVADGGAASTPRHHSRHHHHRHRGSVATVDGSTAPRRARLAHLAQALGTHTIADPRHRMYAFVARLLAGIRASVASLPPPPAATAAPSLTALSRAAADEAAYVAGPAFKDYAPRTFQAIRTASGVSEHDYLDSLTGQTVLAAVPSPGKSKATLYFSHDYKYILKTIKSAEKDALLRMLPEYAAHIVDSSAESLVAPGGLGTAHYPGGTLLCRYYGLHRLAMPAHEDDDELPPAVTEPTIETPPSTSAGFSLRPTRHVYVVVMGNAFPPALDIHARYDLKGSTVGRGARDPTDPFTVRKDLDWVAARRRLAVGHTHAAALAVQMRRDAAFLARAGMMDYSLLVGVHDLRRGNDMAALASPSSVAGEGRLEVLAPASNSAGADGQPSSPLTTLQRGNVGRVGAISDLGLGGDLTLPRVHAPGQMRSEDEAGQLGPELYFVSIIDILTPYNWTKRIEHVFKSVAHDSNAISAIRPDKYGKRFVAFMEKQVLRLSK